MKTQTLVLVTGSNVGNRATYLAKALSNLEKEFGKAIAVSNTYITQAWGITEQNDFLNQALAFNTDILPEKILKIVKEIEKNIGRKPRNIWTDREIDIDIIFYGSIIHKSKDLFIPHPLLHLRKFVLIPLSEIVPAFVHPVFNKTVKQLLKNCEDNLKVEISNQ
ncbi:MAG: 2-amino-4-hydroxy-6-hydroxymethyldihydropteridine diphosphokinase [Bacteroidetes bacterium]|nr:2-amino-4-hydroxy-6-hydroxymethyldihydropteridine diphosphokinase [Bacteroidota bacterium]